MDKLFNIFERERNRLKDEDVTVFYNSKRNTMQYSKDEGTLTVAFNTYEDKNTEGCEKFTFKPKGDNASIFIQQTYDFGQYSKLDIDNLLRMPELLRNIAQDYQYNRDAIGVERQPNKEKTAKKNKNIERD